MIYDVETIRDANNIKTSPLDRVRFECGKVYFEDSGQTSSCLHLREGVIYESYGSGPKPLIRAKSFSAAIPTGPGYVVDGLRFLGTTVGLYTTQHEGTVKNCHFTDMKFGVCGFGIVNNMHVEHNLFERCQMNVSANDSNPLPSERHGWVVIDNDINDGVRLWSGDYYAIGGQNLNNFVILRNRIRKPYFNGVETYQHGNQRMDGNIIHHNEVYLAGNYGIQVGSGFFKITGNSVKYNVIVRSQGPAIKLNGSGNLDNFCEDNYIIQSPAIKDESTKAWEIKGS